MQRTAGRSRAIPPSGSRALDWRLGFKAERFWDDWGFPALVVLVAFDLQRLFEISIPSLNSAKRLALTAGDRPHPLLRHDQRYWRALDDAHYTPSFFFDREQSGT